MSKALYNALDILQRSENTNLASLESRYCKSLFKILIVGRGKEKIFNFIKDGLKFTNALYITSIEAAEDLLPKDKDWDLILCDYRFDFYKRTGYNLFKTVEEKIPFMIIDGYNDIEMRELKKLEILLLPKPFTADKLKVVLNSFYLKKLDSLLI